MNDLLKFNEIDPRMKVIFENAAQVEIIAEQIITLKAEVTIKLNCFDY